MNCPARRHRLPIPQRRQQLPQPCPPGSDTRMPRSQSLAAFGSTALRSVGKGHTSFLKTHAPTRPHVHCHHFSCTYGLLFSPKFPKRSLKSILALSARAFDPGQEPCRVTLGSTGDSCTRADAHPAGIQGPGSNKNQPLTARTSQICSFCYFQKCKKVQSVRARFHN